MGVRENLHRACVRDREACESLRRRDHRDAARGLSQGVRYRPILGLRRRHRFQPRGRCRNRRGGELAVSGSADRPRLHAGCIAGDR